MPNSKATFQEIARRRADLGWTQGELAARAGIPRTTVSAIEGGRLTPSVTAALALAGALECTVEEIFGSGTGVSSAVGQPKWAWQPQSGSCRYWQAEVSGHYWLYPVESAALNPVSHDGIWQGGAAKESSPFPAQNTLIIACCDPAAGWLAQAYAAASGFRMLVLERSGADALELLSRGLIHAAGIHRSTKKQPDRNQESVQTLLGGNHRLIRIAHWQEGLVLAPGEKSRSLRFHARRDARWAMREKGSAARECMDDLLERTPAEGRCVSGHLAVAEAVRAGWADLGVCVKIAAENASLNFLPLREEALDLCFPCSATRDPRIVALVRLLRSRHHRRILSELPGYDARETGDWIL
ncbi:MAG: helix-turn-helix domain-containing protein [Akkermansiaceae bacterium]|jgi:molybdate-binding protein/DNA-binding XRE family transcriptional regulator|nr:helix-turn-helix domain-containing protein [Akkermansiaceae bacterium]